MSNAMKLTEDQATWWKEGYRARVLHESFGRVRDPELAQMCEDAFQRYAPEGIERGPAPTWDEEQAWARAVSTPETQIEALTLGLFEWTARARREASQNPHSDGGEGA